MYERLLLESGKFFIGRRSGIGAKVVDDTEDFTIAVSLPPPEEGKATITYVTKPATFTPGKSFNINIQFRNDGGDDKFFIRLTNKDTGAVIIDYTTILTVSSGNSLSKAFPITLVQTTDFHGLIEVGHIT